ncbi:unnamed protein product [Closterium sp. NIES-53]
MAIPRAALLISIVCLFGAASATAAGPLISSGIGPRRNLTDLRGSRRAFGHVFVPKPRNGDRPVSLNIATSVSPSVDEVGDDKKKDNRYQVEVDVTGKAVYCKCKAAELTMSVAHAGDQFYATGEPARVYARTFQKDLLAEAFQGCCVRLPLASVQLKAPNGDVINLNKGDGDHRFPEERCCLSLNVLVL